MELLIRTKYGCLSNAIKILAIGNGIIKYKSDNSTHFLQHLTEASKLVMQYVAAVSGKGQEVDRVKEQLLQSNPVLEGTVCICQRSTCLVV